MAARFGSRRNADIEIDRRDFRVLPDADPFFRVFRKSSG
jgi:hypothetical protein